MNDDVLRKLPLFWLFFIRLGDEEKESRDVGEPMEPRADLGEAIEQRRGYKRRGNIMREERI